MAQRHVAAEDVGRHHPGEVDRRLGAAELGRIAQLDLFQVVDGPAQLDGHRNGIDPLVHPVLADRLRAEETAVRLPEDDFDRQVFGARIVPRMGVRVEVDLLVIRVAEPDEHLLADAGPGGRGPEQPDDRAALGAAVTGVAAGDHIGRDAALPVGRPGQRDERPLAGDEVFDLDRIADREDVRVAGVHLIIDADPAERADLEPGLFRQLVLRAHADAEDHEVGRIDLSGLREDFERAVGHSA